MQECRTPFPDAETAGEPDPFNGAPYAPSIPAVPPYSYSGAAWGLFAVTIWAGWFISTRFNLTSNLGGYDLIALRFGVSGLLLLPLALRLRFGVGVLSFANAAIIFVGSGAIYSLCSTFGVSYAPAAEGAALTPGVMPMATAILSVIFLKERLTKSQTLGFAFILAGVGAIAGLGIVSGASDEWIGHSLFLTGAWLFAGYTIALRKANLTGLQATALVSVWSSVTFLPIYFFALHPRLFEVSPTEIIVPAIYQGVLTNIVSLVAYGRAVARLGASRAAPFAALIPAMTALLGVAILGEIPSAEIWSGIAAVSVGVYLASGAPLRLRSKMPQAITKVRSR
jgi:drug/metabolite transporter (DMT)-like permease